MLVLGAITFSVNGYSQDLGGALTINAAIDFEDDANIKSGLGDISVWYDDSDVKIYSTS